MSTQVPGQPDVAALMGGPLLEEIAAPIFGALLACGLPAEASVICQAVDYAEALRAECRRREPVPGDEDGEAQPQACPECKKTEHQAEWRPGHFVCGGCNHNYEAGA